MFKNVIATVIKAYLQVKGYTRICDTEVEVLAIYILFELTNFKAFSKYFVIYHKKSF